MTTSRRGFIALATAGAIGGSWGANVLAVTSASTPFPIAPGKVSPTGPGQKYDAAGNALSYPGNTVLCHLNQPGPRFEAISMIAAALREQVGDANIAWTPPSSYHMTVFDGVTNARRHPGDWPHLLPLDAPQEECDRYVGDRLKTFALELELPIRMVVDPALVTRTSTHFPLRPIDATENTRLRRLRNRISAAIGVRHANHDDYAFHTTLGYYIKPFTASEAQRYQKWWLQAVGELRRRVPVIELGAPEYCLFDSMSEFRTQFLLA